MRALGAASEIGDQPPLAILSTAVLAGGVLRRDIRMVRAGAGMLASLLLATLVTGGLKRVVSRTRPHVLLDEGRYEVAWLRPSHGPERSFPSGHAAGSVAVARALGRFFPGTRRGAYAGAALIAMAQVPRGAHYPLDVAAGAAIGIAVEAAADRLARSLSHVVGSRLSA